MICRESNNFNNLYQAQERRRELAYFESRPIDLLGQNLHTQIADARIERPVSVCATGQHLANVFADFVLNQGIQFFVHRQQQITICLSIHREIDQLVRIVNEIKKLNVVVGVQLFD